MAETNSIYVLDSFAVLAYFQAEPGGPIVRDLVRAARDRTGTLFMSMINVGEMFYIAFRRRGPLRAEEMLADLRTLPITLCAATDERVLAAAHIKAEFALSYADAFAVGLARELDATLVTGDPEFESVEQQITMLRLPRK
jgi:predicted nucleic acid-binding protein